MKQARDYRKYNVRLTSADWQRGSGRVINICLAYVLLSGDALRVYYDVMCCKYDVMSGLSANSQGMLPRAHGAQ